MNSTLPSIICAVAFTLTASAEEHGDARIDHFSAARQPRSVADRAGFVEAVRVFIRSCESSTPLTGGAGAAPASAIIEFRDLVASRPVIVIRHKRVFEVVDKSGVRGEPPLRIIDISIVDTGEDRFRVFSYTEGVGNLVEFWKPSKDANERLKKLLQNNKAQQGGADQPATAPESKPEGSEKPKPESEARPR